MVRKSAGLTDRHRKILEFLYDVFYILNVKNIYKRRECRQCDIVLSPELRFYRNASIVEDLIREMLY